MPRDDYAVEIERDRGGKAVRLVFCREPASEYSHPGPIIECACGCGKNVPPPTPHSRHARLYATDACRARVRNRKLAAELADLRARQASLDFTSSGWTPAQRDLCAHLEKRETRKARMLARLEQGEATTWELMALGGAGFSSRLKELRRDGHPISCENRLDYAVYRLEDTP